MLIGSWDNATVPSGKQIREAQFRARKEIIEEKGEKYWQENYVHRWDEREPFCYVEEATLLENSPLLTVDGKIWLPESEKKLIITLIAMSHGGCPAHAHRNQRLTWAPIDERFLQSLIKTNCARNTSLAS